MKTGDKKTLTYSAAVFLFNQLIVIFSPLKLLMDN